MAEPVTFNSFAYLDSLEIQQAETGSTPDGQKVTAILLKGTLLSCSTYLDAGSWEYRRVFLAKVIDDIFAQVAKEEEFAFISIGSYRLLNEGVIGQAFFLAGYKKVTFYPVDPAYKFSPFKEMQVLEEVREDFRKQMSTCYEKKFHEPLPKERIQFLSRAQNVEKYFVKGSKVAVIESLPAYGTMLKEIRENKAPDIHPEDLLVGSYLVPSTEASAVAFFPPEVSYPSKGLTTLHLKLFQEPSSTSFTYINWGAVKFLWMVVLKSSFQLKKDTPNM